MYYRQRDTVSTCLIAVGCAASLVTSAVYADDGAELPGVSVTAKPIVESNSLDNFSSYSTTVTESQLRDLNAVDLPSAVRLTPGVEMSRYDQVGSYSGNQGGAVYIRGLGVSRPGSEIKTYIDGLPVYMGIWDHPLLDLLPVNGMQSITIHKSPEPQLSGNNFASIDLESKRATEEGLHGSGRISDGSFGTLVGQADLAYRHDSVDYVLAVGHAESDGHRANSDGSLSNGMGRVGFKLDDTWSIGASFLIVSNRVGDPGSDLVAPVQPPPRNVSDLNMLTAYAAHDHGDWHGKLQVYDNRGNNNLRNDTVWGTFDTHFDMSGLRWTEQLSPWGGATLLAGIDRDAVSGHVSGPNTGYQRVDLPEFTLTSVHAALSQRVDLSQEWTLIPSAGLRTYRHSLYESTTAPHAGLSLVSAHLTLFANASRGVLYPGLEGPGLQAALPAGLFAGTTWRQLSPESLAHREIGAKWQPADGTQVDLTLFQDSVNNRYVYTLDFTRFGQNTFFNAGAYRTTGSELSVGQQLTQAWKVFAGLTLLHSDLSNLPYAPSNALTVGLNGELGPVHVVFDVQKQSSMHGLTWDRNVTPATAVSNLPVPGFTVANARVSYPVAALGKQGEVFAAIENLFGAHYEYNPGYPMPGLSGRVGLSASF